MTTLNFLWPRWAEVVAHVPAGNVGSWKTIQRAAALLANRYGREQDARFARLAWEEKLIARQAKATAWTRPPHRIRLVRHFLVFALAYAFMWSDIAVGSAAAAEREKEEPGRIYRALGWATFAGSAGDFLSTEHALAGGGSELNPLLQNRGVRASSAVAFPIAANYLTEELREDGHPKLALWCRVAIVGLKGYAVFHNLRAAR